MVVNSTFKTDNLTVWKGSIRFHIGANFRIRIQIQCIWKWIHNTLSTLECWITGKGTVFHKQERVFTFFLAVQDSVLVPLRPVSWDTIAWTGTPPLSPPELYKKNRYRWDKTFLSNRKTKKNIRYRYVPWTSHWSRVLFRFLLTVRNDLISVRNQWEKGHKVI